MAANILQNDRMPYKTQ